MAATKYATPQHRAERKRLTPIVDSGQGWCAERICLMPSRWIEPGTAWDLAHAPGDAGYLGPAHARCNRSEGGRRGRAIQDTPTRWAL